MKRQYKNNLIYGVFAWVLLVLAPSASALPTLQIDPISVSSTQGSFFAVNVTAIGVTDLYAFQFDLGFDPAVLQATGSSEGAFLQSGGTTFFLAGAIDNTSGLVSFIADTLIAPILGVTGTGTLASISFSALSAGTSALMLSNVLFLDSGLNEIQNVTSVGGTVRVSATTNPIPEPNSLILMALGFIVLRVAGGLWKPIIRSSASVGT